MKRVEHELGDLIPGELTKLALIQSDFAVGSYWEHVLQRYVQRSVKSLGLEQSNPKGALRKSDFYLEVHLGAEVFSFEHLYEIDERVVLVEKMLGDSRNTQRYRSKLLGERKMNAKYQALDTIYSRDKELVHIVLASSRTYRQGFDSNSNVGRFCNSGGYLEEFPTVDVFQNICFDFLSHTDNR